MVNSSITVKSTIKNPPLKQNILLQWQHSQGGHPTCALVIDLGACVISMMVWNNKEEKRQSRGTNLNKSN